MKRWIVAGAAVLCLGGAMGLMEISRNQSKADVASSDQIARGRYMVVVAGCNDCHTPGYLAGAGNVPEDRWLVGDAVGFSGPWGTTYPSNLRKLVAGLSEEDWVRHARTLETRPPMPWFNLRAFAEGDLRAMYRYIRSLPENETLVPDYVPPGREPETPHIVMVPQKPKP